jgi:hypothetical protein
MILKEKYKYFDKLLVRSPLFPIEKFVLITSDNNSLNILCHDDAFREAIYYASVDLYKKVLEFTSNKLDSKEEDKLRFSLYKYFSRMCARPTPFGLFAGVTICKIGESNNSLVKENQNTLIDIKLDGQFFFDSISTIVKSREVLSKFCYRANPTIFRVGDDFRYIEKIYNSETKLIDYVYSSAAYSIYLEEVISLTKGIISFEVIVDKFNEKFTDFSKNEVISFLFDLVENYLLISELESGINENNSQETILRRLLEKQIDLPERFHLASESIEKLRLTPFTSEKRTKVFGKMSNDLNEPNIFRVNTFISLSGSIPETTIEETLEAASFLMLDYNTGKSTLLASFKNEFSRKYERQRIPLLELFDPDIGLSYPGSSVPSTLTDDLFLMTKSEHKSPIKTRILSIIHDNAILSKEPIDLSKFDDFREKRNQDLLPLTTSIIAELYSPGQAYKSSIFSIGHSSAINLLARFTGNSEVLSLAKEISKFEIDCLKSSIIADIAHIPRNYRSINVVGRNRIWDYTIEYHAQPVMEESVIELKDIEVSVETHGEMALWIAGTDKRVFTRISNAINTEKTSPIYKFLADVENDGKGTSFGFDIEEEYNFIPRIIYKSVILRPSSWVVQSSEFGPEANKMEANQSELLINLERWRMQRGIPRIVLLPEGDNELLLDLSNIYFFHILLKSMKKSGKALLKEFLFFDLGSIVIDRHNNNYANQVVISLKKNEN